MDFIGELAASDVRTSRSCWLRRPMQSPGELLKQKSWFV